MESTFEQADVFLQCYGHMLQERERQLISTYAQQNKRGWISRKMTYITHGFLKNGFTRVIGQLFLG